MNLQEGHRIPGELEACQPYLSPQEAYGASHHRNHVQKHGTQKGGWE